MMENVKTDLRDGLLIVTIDRPKVLNALNAQTVDEIHKAFVAARDDDNVKAVIVTGGGEKAFVAGADINELAQKTPITGKETSERGQGVLSLIERFPKPVIAAINGFALGGGCELALACHIRIASEKAQFWMGEVKWSMTTPYKIQLPWYVPLGIAMEMTLTGNRMSAQRAYEVGLVNKVVPADQLMTAAEQMARTMMSRGPLAIRAAIEAVIRGSEMPFEEGQFLEATLFGLLCASEDTKEGMKAFLEKRAPQFKGR